MKKSTKKIIMQVVFWLAAVYGIVGLALALPWIFTFTAPVVNAMAVYFLLMPFAIVLALASVAIPIFALIVALFFVDMLLHKMAGLPFMEDMA